jgi:ketosteroid isomerase-like protein
MRARHAVLFTFGLLLGGCHVDHHHGINSRKDIDEIKARYSDWERAFAAKDLNGVMALYAPDVIAYDIVPPLQFVGAEDYRKDYATFFGGFNGPLKITDPSIHVEQSGAVAFAFGLERLRGTTASGARVDMWVRFTDGWKLENGRWLVVHEHVSVPVDLTSAKARLDLTP